MTVPVIMPKLEMSQEVATIIEWLKREGDHVEKGEPLFEIETDKVIIEVESPASGILAGIRVEPQQVVPVAEVIAFILQPGEELPQEAGASAPTPSRALPPRTGGATPVAKRLAHSHGVDLGTVVGTGPRGRITKADIEVEMAQSTSSPAGLPPGRVRATPAARRIARECGADLAAVSGSGPRGRVQATDVHAITQAHTVVSAKSADVIPLTGMRRAIAERMTASYQATPHVTFTVRVKMRVFEQVRAQLNTRARAEGGSHVSVTALMVKTVAWTLRRHPWLNSTLREQEIHLSPDINMGVAVALDAGLIVPVILQADRKSVEEIAAELDDLIIRAREGRLVLVDVAKGTFTITNLGPLGIEQFTALINPPQVAILAVGAIQQEMVVDQKGEANVHPVLRMTLSADHRVVDGVVAARFLGDLQDAMETPGILLW